MKKLLVSLICFLSVFTFIPNIKADEDADSEIHDTVNVYMFTKEGCGYCELASTYFAQLSSDKEYGKMFNLITLKVYDSKWNIVNQDYYNTALEIAKKLGDSFDGTPYIIVGEKGFNGFTDKYDEEIKAEIKRCYEDGYTDPIVNIDQKTDGKDPDKGIKIFINILTISVVVGVTIAFIITAIPKKKKIANNKKEIKQSTKSEKDSIKVPKNKSSNNKKTTQKK